MRICLMVEGQENVTWEQWVGLAEACEAHGLEGMFRSDHYRSLSGRDRPAGTLDAWATLSALAAVTSRIRLGTLVSPVTFRHPSVLAKCAVTADHVSGGRIELGMGAGWHRGEHRAYGFDFPPSAERVELLEEQVEIVHALLSKEHDGPVTFEGRHYRLAGAPGWPKPVQDPHPPLIVGGGGGPRSVALAVRFADEYNANFVTAAECRRVRDALSMACETAGRDPASLPLSFMTFTLVGADRAELEARAGRLLALRGESGDPDAFLASPRDGTIAGTVEEVLEQLADYADAGVERVMLQHILHDDLDAVGLIGRELVPAAASLRSRPA